MRRMWMLCAALALVACSKDDAAKDKAKPGQPGDKAKPCDDDAPTAAAARATSAAIDELLAGVPGDAIALGFIDLPRAPWDLLTGGFLLPLEPAESAALDAELKQYLSVHLGLDVSKAQFAVGYVAGPPPRGAVLVKSISGPAFSSGEDYQGAKLRPIDGEVVVAAKGDLVILGTDPAVRQVLDTLAGTQPSVVKAKPELVEWLKGQGKGAILAAAMTTGPGLTPPPPFNGLRRGAVAFGDGFVRAAIEGDAAGLDALQTQADLLLSTLQAEVEQGKVRSLAEGPPPEAVGAMLASHYVKSMVKKIKPKRDGERLSVEINFDFSGASSMVAVAGIGAAVAIPAFLTYRGKASMAPPPTMGMPYPEGPGMPDSPSPAAAGDVPPSGPE